MGTPALEFRSGVRSSHSDILTAAALRVLESLSHLDEARVARMQERLERRRHRAETGEPLDFLPEDHRIAGTEFTARDAREGRFDGCEIPSDLRRQWIQGTGPATRPRTETAKSIRNVAYALLSGADGWMFDGEDALGQVDTMSLDNQRNLKLAIAKDEVYLAAAEQVAVEMNAWAQGFFGREIIEDWRAQLDFTTKIYRARGLHLEDRHVRFADGRGFSASITDAVLYVVNNFERLRAEGSSIVLYLPKIQTAAEAALWTRILSGIEDELELARGTIKAYVLVEQLEASFQLMEIRAALAPHFVGFNTGRWDYINSVADALHGDPEFQNPNIDAIGMTYGYMRVYEDRVRRAVNTPDRNGRCALWQGGMEANIPVGGEAGVAASMKKAVAGAEREEQAGASGKWVAHWKMVHIVRPVWEREGRDNQLGRAFPPLGYGPEDAQGLSLLEPAPRTVRGARDLLSVALQYGNAFERGFQAAALKPADFFGDEDVLYLMEDMATGEIRVSILWEWLHKGARFSEADPETGVQAGDPFTRALFDRLLVEEFEKLRVADPRDVHADSKETTLPIAKAILAACVASDTKLPWYVDPLNLCLDDHDLGRARDRVTKFIETFVTDNVRRTESPRFQT